MENQNQEQNQNRLTKEQYMIFASGRRGNDVPERLVTEPMKSGMRFNIFAALFGVYYYAYRRMYLEAVWLLIVCILLVLIPYVGGWLPVLLFGFAFYPLYRKRAEKLADDAASCNQDINTCLREKGGASAAALLIAFGITAVVVTLIVFIDIY